MKSAEFIVEGTEIVVGDQVVAKRSARGGDLGPAIHMAVTKDEWDRVKGQRANTDIQSYDIATAETIVNDMVKQGGEIIWKSAAEYNADARELENHRFRNNADVQSGFAAAINSTRDNASATAKASLSRIK